MNEDTQMLNPQQVAEILGVHPKTVHLWLRSGKLQGTKISYRAWRIPRSALDSFIQSNSNTRLGQSAEQTWKNDGQPDTTHHSTKAKEKIPEELRTGEISPQSKMKHYIWDIMGEQPPGE
jgi:excisionase family DNA binding protein